MAGLSFIGNFTASRVLDITLDHILKSQMNYFGIFGGSLSGSQLNQAPGASPTTVTAHEPANLVFGGNYFTSLAANLSAGFTSVSQPRQLDATLFCAFTAGVPGWSAGTAFSSGLINLWGDDTGNGAGRMTIGLHKTAAGVPYIVLRWGLSANTPILTCAIPFDWTTATGPILVIASRDSAGGMRMEMRNNGAVYKAVATTTPVAIPSTSLNWRGFTGQLSTFLVTNQRMYAAAIWSATMTAEQMSAELDVMQVNLASHLAL
ncbi:TPA: hypothetical protein QHR21_000986 [Klebsiella pneumoniae]|nr:hypothetical protein [Klebsiella pneumoniae]